MGERAIGAAESVLVGLADALFDRREAHPVAGRREVRGAVREVLEQGGGVTSMLEERRELGVGVLERSIALERLDEQRLRARKISELHHEERRLVERTSSPRGVGVPFGPTLEQVRERRVIAEAPVVLPEVSERLEIVGVPP